MSIQDQLNRPLHDLRISVTDRCNFRCVYCMPKEVFGADFAFLPSDQLLSFEEITRLTHIFVEHGVEKLRITGGEPLVRRDLEELIAMLSNIEGVRDIAMTTNASMLPTKAEKLKRAGLNRVTVSLDALDDAVFMAMNDVKFPVSKVLAGIKAAEEAELTPIKINMVVKRGSNDNQILPMAEYFRNSGHILRFIEYMDVGNTNGWRLEDTVSARDIHALLDKEWGVERIPPNYPGEVANRFRYRDGKGEVGFVASVSQPFCQGCSRARLSAEGKLYTCLFSAEGHDFRELLRNGASDEDLDAYLQRIWGQRTDRYSELRSSQTVGLPKVEMSHIGG